MATTLTYSTTTLTLEDDMVWRDEFAWQAVVQSTAFTIAGAFVVDAAQKQAGRPITLDGSHAWIDRGLLTTLKSWAESPGRVMTLFYRGVSHSVVFDQERGAIEATPVIDYADPDNTDLYAVTLRFLEV